MERRIACPCSTSVPHPLASGRSQGQVWSVGPREFACLVALKNLQLPGKHTGCLHCSRPQMKQTGHTYAASGRALGRVLLSRLGNGRARHSRGSYSFLPLHSLTQHPLRQQRPHNSHQSCNRTVPENLVVPPLQGAATHKAVSRMGRTTQRVVGYFLDPVLTRLFGSTQREHPENW